MHSAGLGGDNFLGCVRFERQPPADLRKSNFFSFEVSLEDLNREQILIEEAHFIEFVGGPEELKLKNGIKYGGTFRYANGMRQQDSFVVRLVDSASEQPVPYEGQDGDPKMQRVLLTHEVTCARCSQKKSCGNKNETPSDPVICDNRTMKFYLKCNQNCLKSAGNPRDMRRFRVMFFRDENWKMKLNVLGTSENMFVHNNSKHSRKRAIFHKSDSIINKRSRLQEECLPKVHVIYPEKGFFSQRIFVSGENFNPCFQICLNNTPLRTKFLGPTALSANIPPYSRDCDFYVSVREKNKIYCNRVLFKYVYKSNIVPIVTEVCQKGPGQVIIYGHNLDSDGLEVFMGMTPLRMQTSRELIKAELQEYSGNPVHAYMPITIRWEDMLIFYPNDSSMTFINREFICNSHNLGNQKTEDFAVTLQPQCQDIAEQNVSEESDVSSVDVSGVSPVPLTQSDQVLDANPSCMAVPMMSNAPPSYPASYSNNSLICNASVSQYKNQMFHSNGSSDYPFIHTPMSILQRNRNLTA